MLRSLLAVLAVLTLAACGREAEAPDQKAGAPGKVMSRTRILNKVWGYESDPLTNVVDVYIRRIRAKLELDPEHGLIRTVRGYGYKLEAG